MPIIYLDMDGVLADFDSRAGAILGSPPAEYEATHGTRAFWAALRTVSDLYATLPLLPDARALWAGVRLLGETEPTILTGVPASWPDAADQKRAWVVRHFPEAAGVITCFAKDKATHCRPGDVLIDDRPKYQDRWEAAGGVWITHRSAAESLHALWEHLIRVRERA